MPWQELWRHAPVLSTLLAVALAGCGHPASALKPSRYLNGKPASDTAIVFVHGVFGDSDATWAFNDKVSFPGLVQTDSEFGGADVYVHEYFSPTLSKASRIPAVAAQMLVDLENDRVFDQHRHVIFVCHSMGGLIAREFILQAILSHRDWIAKIPMIYFYATPTEGSQIAKLAKFLSKNPQLGDMIPIDDNTYLQSIVIRWDSSPDLKAIDSFCAVENLDVASQTVVGFGSATNLCNNSPVPVAANHIDIVKPKDRKATSYRALVNAFRASRTKWVSKNAAIPWTDPNTPPEYHRDLAGGKLADVWADYFDGSTKNWEKPANWPVVHPKEGEGYLTMAGKGCAEPGDLGSEVFHDIDATFRVKFEAGNRFELLTRVYPNGACASSPGSPGSAYRFLVTRTAARTKGINLRIDAKVCLAGQPNTADCSDLTPPANEVDCAECKMDDLLQLRAVVQKNAVSFYPTLFASGPSARAPHALGELPFVDEQARLGYYGNIAFRLPDDSSRIGLQMLAVGKTAAKAQDE